MKISTRGALGLLGLMMAGSASAQLTLEEYQAARSSTEKIEREAAKMYLSGISGSLEAINMNYREKYNTSLFCVAAKFPLSDPSAISRTVDGFIEKHPVVAHNHASQPLEYLVVTAIRYTYPCPA